MAQNKWYAITGGPSTGKTTLIRELEKRGYKTVPEAARIYFERELAKGRTIKEIRTDEKLCQEEITKLKIETQKKLDPNQVTFFDRGMHDSHAYLNYYGFEIADWVEQAMKSTHYQKVFIPDTLPIYEEDNVRTEDADFPAKINKQLRESYEKYGHEVIDVPVLPPAERAQFILDRIDQK